MLVDYRKAEEYLAGYKLNLGFDERSAKLTYLRLSNQIPPDHLVMDVEVEILPIPITARNEVSVKTALGQIPNDFRPATLVEFLAFEARNNYLKRKEEIFVLIPGAARKCPCCPNFLYPFVYFKDGQRHFEEIFEPSLTELYQLASWGKWRVAVVRKAATKLAL